MSVNDRLEKVQVLLRVVFQVSILNDQVIPRCCGNASVQSCALAFIDLVSQVLDGEVRVLLLVAHDGALGVITAAIVNNDQFLSPTIREVHGLDLVKDVVDGVGLVVGRHDDTKGLHGGEINPKRSRKRKLVRSNATPCLMPCAWGF